jgi:hypothetical protein
MGCSTALSLQGAINFAPTNYYRRGAIHRVRSDFFARLLSTQTRSADNSSDLYVHQLSSVAVMVISARSTRDTGQLAFAVVVASVNCC